MAMAVRSAQVSKRKPLIMIFLMDDHLSGLVFLGIKAIEYTKSGTNISCRASTSILSPPVCCNRLSCFSSYISQ